MSAATMFHAEKMLVKECPISGYFVVDRLPMRQVKENKNLRHRWQLLSADQKEYKLFRSKSAALKALSAKSTFLIEDKLSGAGETFIGTIDEAISYVKSQTSIYHPLTLWNNDNKKIGEAKEICGKVAYYPIG